VVMSGQSEGRRNGVAIVCDKSSARAIIGYDTVNNRILSVRTSAETGLGVWSNADTCGQGEGGKGPCGRPQDGTFL